MSRLLNKQLFSILESLKEANQTIKDLLDSSQWDDLEGLLADCQEGAIAIGNQIELAYGEGWKSVQALEEYCETLYCIMEKKDDNISGKKFCALAETQLSGIEKFMQQELPDNLEVVFLPYKAAMWDSLEGIYLAAKEDSKCDVYCMPIPYYDLNGDGTYGELHDEREEYPANIEIIDWQTYQLEKKKPDIIFIHNPYDDCNIVTSVEPRFYAKRLRHYTDMLVYVPYFVLDEIEEGNNAAIENVKHFCFLPGTVYANKVIVQSENMKKIYVNEYVQAAKEQGIEVDRKQIENKFVGWGSPKFDKVHSTKKEELKLPEDWIKIIQKPDGSYKKIILYNTNIDSVLSQDNKMLQKIRRVFEVFKKRRDKVALLWHPHLLSEDTLKTMQDEMLEEYKEIVNKYREEGWGIYDDTSGMDRLMAFSDAYYGDYSSVMQLFREAHKPVMVQNPNCVLKNGNAFSMAMDNIVEYNGALWFMTLLDNDIYRMEKGSLEASFIKRILLDRKKNWECPQYGKIYIYSNKIFVIPWIADSIAVYDIGNDEIRYIAYRNANRGMSFEEGIIKENLLYLIPCGGDCILHIDMDTEKMEEIPISSDSQNNELRGYAWGSVFVDNNKIYFTALFQNIIYCFDMKTRKIETYNFELLGDGGGGICGDEETVWIIPRKTEKIFCWDRKRKELLTYKNFPRGYHPGESWSFHKIWMDDNLYLLPREANMCIMVDKNSGEMKRVFEADSSRDIGNWYDKYMFYSHIWRERNRVRVIETKTGNIYSLDADGNGHEEYIKGPTDTDVKIDLDDIIYERYNRTGSLECYTDNVIDYTSEIETYTNEYGKYIFYEIRNLMVQVFED